jgi:hydroxymethylpyrimidine/phosphomethylpyrimidine kinase
VKGQGRRPAVLCPAVLCIGGLDPSGGAGLLADVEAVRAAGGRPIVAATALTVQTRRGVSQVVPIASALVVAQIERLLDDEAPLAVKLGMLGTRSVARSVADCLARSLGRRPLVIDPVLRSTSGMSLFQGSPARDYAALLAIGRVVTPNHSEAEQLLGRKLGPSRRAREAAAAELADVSGLAIVLKGGHFPGGADDLVFDAGRITWLAGKRLRRSRRGTGCRFASTLATRLALGDDLVRATRAAKSYVAEYLSATAHPTLPRKRGRSDARAPLTLPSPASGGGG